jgi:hypothetical protein
MGTNEKINNDPHALKTWRTKHYTKNTRKGVWNVLLNPPKIKKDN